MPERQVMAALPQVVCHDSDMKAAPDTYTVARHLRSKMERATLLQHAERERVWTGSCTRGQQHSAVSDHEDPCTEFKVWAPVEAWGSA